MERIILILRIFIWWLLIDSAMAAGKLQSPFLLGFSIAAMSYWYWRYPVFKKDE
jgi:hypothetical protein